MSCYNSSVIDAPIEKVWNEIKDFHNMQWAKGVVEAVDVVGDISGSEVGAKRIINGAFHETLMTLNHKDYSFTYKITDGPGAVAKDAVSNYIGEVSLHRVTDTNQTYFLWTSSYESKDGTAVADLCNPVYQAVLGAAKNNIKR